MIVVDKYPISEKIKDIFLGIERDLIVCEAIDKLQKKVTKGLTRIELNKTINAETYRLATHIYNLHLERAIINTSELVFGNQISLSRLDKTFSKEMLKQLQPKHKEINDIRDNFLGHKNYRIQDPIAIGLTKVASRYIQSIKDVIKDIEGIDLEYAQYKKECANNCLYDYFSEAFEKTMEFWEIEIKKEVNHTN